MNKTVAEKCREITNATTDARRQKYVKQNQKYADKLVATHIYRACRKGFGSVSLVIPKKYSATIVYETLIEKGFKVERASRNGKQIVKAIW